MPACRSCGCQGHGPTWQVRCVECGRDKWPVAVERPVGYVCALCRMGGTRKAGARKGMAARRQKAANALAERASGTIPLGAAS